MKITLKIAILFIAITLAIGGVMIFAKTRVEPPIAQKETNQFTIDIKKCIDGFDKDMNTDEEDSLYGKTVRRIKIYVKEKRMEENDGDKFINSTVRLYATHFMKDSFKKFQQSVWNSHDHIHMLSVINELRSLKHFDNSPAINRQIGDSLSIIQSVIAKYNNARSLCGSLKFTGIDNARRTIDKAGDYIEDKYLSNCTEIVNGLKDVRRKLGESHYTYITNRIEKLSDYTSFISMYHFNEYTKEIIKDLRDYEDNAVSLYGYKEDTGDLKNRAERYCDQANSYFEYY